MHDFIKIAQCGVQFGVQRQATLQDKFGIHALPCITFLPFVHKYNGT